MKSIEKKYLQKKNEFPREKIIQFRVPEGLYNTIAIKANEDTRFIGQPNLYVRHLLEKQFEPTDEKSNKKLLLLISDKMERIINKLDVLQVSQEFQIEYDIGHHSQTPEEDVEQQEAILKPRIESAWNIIIRKAFEVGSSVQRIIAEQITG